MAIFTAYLFGIFGALFGITLRVSILGRRAFFVSSAFVLAIGGVLAGWLAVPNGVNPVHVLGALALAGGLMYWHSLQYERDLKIFALVAPRLSGYAKRNFHSLDADGDGLLTSADLRQACEGFDETSNDRVMVMNLLSDLSFIGHEVDSKVAMPMSPASPHMTVIVYYGISAEDLESYPRRAAERFEASACLLQDH